MTKNVYMQSSRSGYDAKGIYDAGRITVLSGSKIRTYVDNHLKIEGDYTILLREDPSIVDSNGTVLKDCVFKSPSYAARFVCGRNANGYITWKVDTGDNLKKWLAEK